MESGMNIYFLLKTESHTSGLPLPKVRLGESEYALSNCLKGTLLHIWYPVNFAILILRILELFAREVCKFLKK